MQTEATEGECMSGFCSKLSKRCTYFPARVNRGSAFAELAEYCKALNDYNAALLTHKNDSGIYRSRGWVFERLGLIDRARADYRRALELKADDTWVQKAITRLP